jgi:hypothetical protein
MNLQEDVLEIERALDKAGASLERMLAAAGVNRSTWTRWKNGSVTGARYDTISRVRSAADAAIAATKGLSAHPAQDAA